MFLAPRKGGSFSSGQRGVWGTWKGCRSFLLSWQHLRGRLSPGLHCGRCPPGAPERDTSPHLIRAVRVCRGHTGSHRVIAARLLGSRALRFPLQLPGEAVCRSVVCTTPSPQCPRELTGERLQSVLSHPLSWVFSGLFEGSHLPFEAVTLSSRWR